MTRDLGICDEVMARTFGQGDDDEDDERRGACGGGDRPNPNKCGNGTLPQFPPEEIQEEADEGNYLYLEFFRNQIFREGMPEPPGLVLDGVDMSPQRYENILFKIHYLVKSANYFWIYLVELPRCGHF